MSKKGGRVGANLAASVAETGNVRAINEDEPSPVVLKLTIPAEIYAKYEELANEQDLTIAELMAHRLARCAAHSSIRSLYFSEAQVRQLESLLQTRPLDDPVKALATIASWFKFRINEFNPVPVSAQQAKRIHLGAYKGCTPEEHLHRIIEGAISQATGV